MKYYKQKPPDDNSRRLIKYKTELKKIHWYKYNEDISRPWTIQAYIATKDLIKTQLLQGIFK